MSETFFIEQDIEKLKKKVKTVDTTAINLRINDIAINVKTFGAKGDGVTDDTLAIQNTIDSLKLTGGTVFFPKGIYRTNASINLYSNIKLKGDGWTNTFIKPLNTAVIDNNHGVVQNYGFTTGVNLWDYYKPYPAGLSMGIQLEDICIDGNRANQVTGNGLCIYGGKWTFKNISVINTANRGIWTEVGYPISSTSGDDNDDYINMHESIAKTVYICNTNDIGWYFYGANDSYIDNIQIKSTGDTAFKCGGAAFGLKIGSIHMYFTNLNPLKTGTYMAVFDCSIQADKIFIDSPTKNGLGIYASGCIVNQILVIKRNEARLDTFYGIRIIGDRNYIGHIMSNQQTLKTAPDLGTLDGGDVLVDGSYNIISSLNITGIDTATIPSIGATMNGQYNIIESCNIQGYTNNTSSYALKVNAPAQCNKISGTICNVANGLHYVNTYDLISNVIELRLKGITGTPVKTYQIVFKSSIKYYIVETCENITMGNTTFNSLISKTVNIIPTVTSNSGTLAMSSAGGSFRSISAPGSLTISLITSSKAGDRIVIKVTNTAVTSSIITFDAGFILKTITSNTKTLAVNESLIVEIICIADNGNWMEL